jgi:hypothetical protein
MTDGFATFAIDTGREARIVGLPAGGDDWHDFGQYDYETWQHCAVGGGVARARLDEASATVLVERLVPDQRTWTEWNRQALDPDAGPYQLVCGRHALAVFSVSISGIETLQWFDDGPSGWETLPAPEVTGPRCCLAIAAADGTRIAWPSAGWGLPQVMRPGETSWSRLADATESDVRLYSDGVKIVASSTGDGGTEVGVIDS